MVHLLHSLFLQVNYAFDTENASATQKYEPHSDGEVIYRLVSHLDCMYAVCIHVLIVSRYFHVLLQ